MELKQTVKLMNSKDYKERFIAEYLQLKIRYDKLLNLLIKWDNKELDFKPSCPRSLYDIQIKSMYDYLKALEERAKIENINLEAYNV